MSFHSPTLSSRTRHRKHWLTWPLYRDIIEWLCQKGSGPTVIKAQIANGRIEGWNLRNRSTKMGCTWNRSIFPFLLGPAGGCITSRTGYNTLWLRHLSIAQIGLFFHRWWRWPLPRFELFSPRRLIQSDILEDPTKTGWKLLLNMTMVHYSYEWHFPPSNKTSRRRCASDRHGRFSFCTSRAPTPLEII